MSARDRRVHPHQLLSFDEVAAAYDRAGASYTAYADGDARRLFSFKGLHAYADRQVWSALARELRELRASGADSIRILDVGCGPGTWLRRLVTRAFELEFTTIVARGFDVSEVQIKAARRSARELCALPGVDLKFEVADVRDPLPEPDGSVDLAVCLYSVLNHVPAGGLQGVIAELARVTRGCFVTTVRAIGSTPTVFVDSVENARSYSFDHDKDQCQIELSNGRRLALSAHLFSSRELRRLVDRSFDIEDLCGLDIFHSRFAPDSRWNPVRALVDRPLERKLARLEETYARSPAFMDRASHLLLVGRRRGAKGRVFDGGGRARR